MKKSRTVNSNEKAVQRLLQDIDVELNIAYADPKRIIFPDLAPYYAHHVDSPLVERLTSSAKAAATSIEGQNFRQHLSEALHRASESTLGNSRTLLLIDLSHEVAIEAFSESLWRRLLWRPDKASLPIWIGDLAVRLEEWKIHIDLEPAEWHRLITTVEPLGFETLLRWSFLQASGMSLLDRKQHLHHVISTAVQRLRQDSHEFLSADVDPLETQHHLSDLLLANWEFCPLPSGDQGHSWEDEQAIEALRRDLEPTLHVQDRYLAGATGRDDVDFPSLEEA